MIALIQRVSSAQVQVDGQLIGAIRAGLLAFIAVVPEDTDDTAGRLLARLLHYRVFGDAQGRMNLSLRDTRGGLLLVPQFTLAADTRSGTRPGFSGAAAPRLASSLFDSLARRAQAEHPEVALGQFGASMQVSLVNDGPVTFWLDTGAQM